MITDEVNEARGSEGCSRDTAFMPSASLLWGCGVNQAGRQLLVERRWGRERRKEEAESRGRVGGEGLVHIIAGGGWRRGEWGSVCALLVPDDEHGQRLHGGSPPGLLWTKLIGSDQYAGETLPYLHLERDINIWKSKGKTMHGASGRT